jgi:hypothetical protein
MSHTISPLYLEVKIGRNFAAVRWHSKVSPNFYFIYIGLSGRALLYPCPKPGFVSDRTGYFHAVACGVRFISSCYKCVRPRRTMHCGRRTRFLSSCCKCVRAQENLCAICGHLWRASALAAVRFESKSSSRLGWTICPISLRSQPQLKS